MSEAYLGENIKKLGFGLMRLPMDGDNIDIEQTKRMVDSFMAKGFTYFDTAYVYINGRSEVALKEAVVDRYPRESFQAATKMPIFMINNHDDMERIFNESCTRAGVDYYDFYLLHALGKESFAKTEEVGAWDFIKQLKADGRVKHIGFSFHDTADVLDEILTKHPESEFVQLQINYADWENDDVQSRKCYEVAMKHNKPVIIMEPVKGGSLAAMTPDIHKMFQDVNPDASVASWAVRYAASLDNIITVLSGMSNEEQLNDNCSFMENFKPLTDSERAVIGKVLEELGKIETIPCTACKYCVDDCPQKINIPEIIATLNTRTVYNDPVGMKGHYNFVVRNSAKASDCIACGACEGHCPQHIQIIDTLKEAVSQFE